MSITKPRTPPGVMELLPPAQLAFQRMLGVIQGTFSSYGFLPVETPVFELTDILLTKSGGETEKQVFFVEKTGDIQNRRNDPAKYGDKQPGEALRFDLTVPLARYVAEHEHELAFPFRRYQMQRVYRGERPQRGRLNEFYQCDIDVIGKDMLSPAYDAELPAIICEIFDQLAFGDFTINFSNRKILLGLLDAHSIPKTSQVLILRALDKLDKMGRTNVFALLNGPHEYEVPIQGTLERETFINKLLDLAELNSSYDDILREIARLPQSPQLEEGYKELQVVCDGLTALGVPEKRARLNLGIVRGLDYYTGTVYETTVDAHPEFGSICSGGRYENLAGHYTKSKLPGVGISIGASRLFDQLRATDWAGATMSHTTELLVTMLDPSLYSDYLRLAAELRQAGVKVELMLQGGDLKKQMKYADRAGIRHVLLMGSEEKARAAATIKDLATGQQREIPLAGLAAGFRALRD